MKTSETIFHKARKSPRKRWSLVDDSIEILCLDHVQWISSNIYFEDVKKSFEITFGR